MRSENFAFAGQRSFRTETIPSSPQNIPSRLLEYTLAAR